MNRRQAILRTGAGLGGIALSSVFQDANLLAGEKQGPHFAPKAKHIIQIFCAGGPSQMDTFDPKPELQRLDGKSVKELGEKYIASLPKIATEMNRMGGKLFGSPYKFSKQGQSGIEVSELFPKLSKCIDDMCIIRSMHTKSSVHEPAQLMMNTGEGTLVRPSIGSWTVYGLGTENKNLPSFVALHPNGSTSSGDKHWSNAFLPSNNTGTGIATKNMDVTKMISHLRSNSTSLREQRRQLDLLAKMNSKHLENRSKREFLQGRMQSFETAFRMQIEASDAFDISREPKHVRELYGDTQQGRQLMLARRLIERGVRFVQAWHLNWDTHEDNDRRHKKLCSEEADQSLYALITDLKERGLLEDTIVMWGGEFGRTPTTDVNGKRAVRGRDHNAGGFSMWLAGGGFKGGYAHGSTDPFGAVAVEKIHGLP